MLEGADVRAGDKQGDEQRSPKESGRLRHGTDRELYEARQNEPLQIHTRKEYN